MYAGAVWRGDFGIKESGGGVIFKGTMAINAASALGVINLAIR